MWVPKRWNGCISDVQNLKFVHLEQNMGLMLVGYVVFVAVVVPAVVVVVVVVAAAVGRNNRGPPNLYSCNMLQLWKFNGTRFGIRLKV